MLTSAEEVELELYRAAPKEERFWQYQEKLQELKDQFLEAEEVAEATLRESFVLQVTV